MKRNGHLLLSDSFFIKWNEPTLSYLSSILSSDFEEKKKKKCKNGKRVLKLKHFENSYNLNHFCYRKKINVKHWLKLSLSIVQAAILILDLNFE